MNPVASATSIIFSEDWLSWMTSVAYSPSLGHSVGLGFIKKGHERMGEIVTACNPLQGQKIDVEIVFPHFIDLKGERLRV